jgi:hypothetical protein
MVASLAFTQMVKVRFLVKALPHEALFEQTLNLKIERAVVQGQYMLSS